MNQPILLKNSSKRFYSIFLFSVLVVFYFCVLFCLSKRRWTYFCNWRYTNYLLTYLLTLTLLVSKVNKLRELNLSSYVLSLSDEINFVVRDQIYAPALLFRAGFRFVGALCQIVVGGLFLSIAKLNL